MSSIRAINWRSRLQNHDKNNRKKGRASADAVITNMWCQDESRDKKKSPEKCPWPGSVHVFLILAPGHHRPLSGGPHAARLGACGGPSSVLPCVRGVHLCGILTNSMGCEVTKRRGECVKEFRRTASRVQSDHCEGVSHVQGESGGRLETHKSIQFFHERRYGAWMMSPLLVTTSSCEILPMALRWSWASWMYWSVWGSSGWPYP